MCKKTCKRVKAIPTEISLHDDRCFTGYCDLCKEPAYYCEEVKKYRHCQCCQLFNKKNKKIGGIDDD